MARRIARAALLLFLCVPVLRAQEPAARPPTDPAVDFRMLVLGYFDAGSLADFRERVQRYVTLRSKLQEGLTPLRVTANPAEIHSAEASLARRIRAARASARRGELLAPAIEAQIKKVLVLQMNQATLPSIMDDNPGEFRFKLNGTYPKKRPLSTMPPGILLLLPDLGEDMEYRFIGRHLIVRDVRANVILDEIPYAFECRDCDLKAHDDEN